jgi:hypothetical protein
MPCQENRRQAKPVAGLALDRLPTYCCWLKARIMQSAACGLSSRGIRAAQPSDQASSGLVDWDVLQHDKIRRMSRERAGADDPSLAPALQGEGQNGRSDDLVP